MEELIPLSVVKRIQYVHQPPIMKQVLCVWVMLRRIVSNGRLIFGQEWLIIGMDLDGELNLLH